jgi:dolichol-phosphate mannosyltransferase
MNPKKPPDERRRRVTILVPAFNEAATVDGLLERFRGLRDAHSDLELDLLLVDDGSSDGTVDRLIELALPDDAVRAVELSRNFGSHYAITAGFHHVETDAVIVLGADLQEPPELVARFLAEWRGGADVVWGIRSVRAQRSKVYDAASTAFSRLFSRTAGLANYPAEGPSGVLVDRAVVDTVVAMPEHNRNVLALIAWVGFTQTRVAYEQAPRAHGESRWTRAKILRLAVDSMVQFSSAPLRACSTLGALAATLGVLYALVLIVRSLVGVTTPSGWPTAIVVTLIMGGLQLLTLGVIGEYLWRGVDETRGRPLFVVRRVRRPGDAIAAITPTPSDAAEETHQ